MYYTVKGRNTGKEITIKSDYDSFLIQFYGCDEEPEQDVEGRYIVDDESIESTIGEYPETIIINSWGGYRPGSGRKPVDEPRKPYAFRLTQEEHAKVKEFIRELKNSAYGPRPWAKEEK